MTSIISRCKSLEQYVFARVRLFFLRYRLWYVQLTTSLWGSSLCVASADAGKSHVSPCIFNGRYVAVSAKIAIRWRSRDTVVPPLRRRFPPLQSRTYSGPAFGTRSGHETKSPQKLRHHRQPIVRDVTTVLYCIADVVT